MTHFSRDALFYVYRTYGIVDRHLSDSCVSQVCGLFPSSPSHAANRQYQALSAAYAASCSIR